MTYEFKFNALALEPHDFRGAEATCSHRYSDGTYCGLYYIEHAVDEKEK